MHGRSTIPRTAFFLTVCFTDVTNGDEQDLVDGSSTHIEAVTVELGDDRYGIAATYVSRVVRMVKIAPLPGAPEVVAGVIDVAGDVVPVVDPRVPLAHPRRPPRSQDQLVLAHTGSRLVAVWVDRALAFTKFEAADVQRVEEVVRGVAPVAGLTNTPEGLLVITDLDAFLSLEDKAQLQVALDAQADA